MRVSLSLPPPPICVNQTNIYQSKIDSSLLSLNDICDQLYPEKHQGV